MRKKEMPLAPVGTVLPGEEPKLTIRVLKRCNFRCPSCATFSSPDEWAKLSLAEIRVIAENLRREEFSGVINVSGGETTLHPELDAILATLSAGVTKARIVLFTNGSWIGSSGWQLRLDRFLSFPNVLIRLSLDSEHVQGEANATGKDLDSVRKHSFERAGAFLEACLKAGATPGTRYDVAFKGTEREARTFLRELGPVPLYLITFQKDPHNRPRQDGYFAVDVDDAGAAAVYLTIGHFASRESLGGLNRIPEALSHNRKRLGTKDPCARN
jgi:uncharacterized Fe-S cluster-containing radical SAM superfamily protein